MFLILIYLCDIIFFMDIGIIIKTLCSANGINIKKLSESTGLSYSSLIFSIHKNNFSVKNFIKIMNSLGYNVTVTDSKDPSKVVVDFKENTVEFARW